MAASADEDCRHMGRALELARRGEGLVEPNPMVGCVLVRDGQVVGEGWHGKFGGPHAEVEALSAAGAAARGATAYVSLEPCCRQGKTPPCTKALAAAGVKRVVAGCRDPSPAVSGQGLAELTAAGIACEVGLLADAAEDLIAPFAKLVTLRRPWVIAKWAMTLDGKLATRTGASRWISGEQSRAMVHTLRGRVDAVLVGRGTVEHDDPLLTARPPGPRLAVRVVLDSQAALSVESQLVKTAADAPVLVAASIDAPGDRCQRLRDRGVEVWQSAAGDRTGRLLDLLDELGRRQLTNLLVEGGAEVLGVFLDLGEIDEVHAFVAPRLAGGAGLSPIAGHGVEDMAEALNLRCPRIEQVGEDAHIWCRR